MARFIGVINKSINKYKKLPIAAKATLWFILCSTLQKGISFLTTPIFTRIMDTEQYGQFSIYNSWLQTFTIITTLRLDYAVFNKGMSKYKDDRDGYTSTMQTITALLGVIVFFVYMCYKNQINAFIELPTYIMILMFVELMFTPATQFWTLRQRYEYKYVPVVVVTLTLSLLNAIVGVLMVLSSTEKRYARILSCILVSIVVGCILFVVNHMRGKKWLNLSYAKFAITFNAPLLIHYISLYILDQFDRIMVQKMVSISATALYSVAYNAGMLTKILTQSINSALVPWQYDQLEKKNLKRIDDMLFLIFCLIAVGCLAFAAFAPEFVKLLAGSQYNEAAHVVPPIVLSTFFTFAYTTIANVEFYYDQNKFTMYISVAGAALNILLNYIGIQLFGYVAAAYTTLICYVIFTFAHYTYMTISTKKKLNVDRVFNTKRFALLCIVFLLLGLLVAFFYEIFIIRFVIVIIILTLGILNRNKLIDNLNTLRK